MKFLRMKISLVSFVALIPVEMGASARSQKIYAIKCNLQASWLN